MPLFPDPLVGKPGRASPGSRRRTLWVGSLLVLLVGCLAAASYSWASLERRRARNRRILIEAASRAGIAAPLVLAVAEVESGFDDRAVSNKGAVGLMQVLPSTGKEVAGRLDLELWDLASPADNALIGATYLRELRARYGGDLHLALAAYNAGPERVKAWRKSAGSGCGGREVVERHAFSTTRRYVKRVLAARSKYARAMGGGR